MVCIFCPPYSSIAALFARAQHDDIHHVRRASIAPLGSDISSFNVVEMGRFFYCCEGFHGPHLGDTNDFCADCLHKRCDRCPTESPSRPSGRYASRSQVALATPTTKHKNERPSLNGDKPISAKGARSVTKTRLLPGSIHESYKYLADRQAGREPISPNADRRQIHASGVRHREKSENGKIVGSRSHDRPDYTDIEHDTGNSKAVASSLRRPTSPNKDSHTSADCQEGASNTHLRRKKGRGSRPQTPSEAQGPFLKCPFWKHDSKKYPSCEKGGWPTVSRLKSVLNVRSMPSNEC